MRTHTNRSAKIMYPRKQYKYAFLLLIVLTLFVAFASAAKAQTIIRDTEIENIIREWSAPVIKAADMEPEQINFILVQNPAINAFVAGGPNIFLFTGLIEKADTPDEVIGVIAHELGHIRGGHLVRTRGAASNASYESLLGTLLGIGAAVLTGEGDLGAAIIAGSQGSAINRYLAFSRVQESSADQAALQYLERAEMNPQGLVNFMRKLENEELLPASQQSEYVRTHPLTANRIDALQQGVRDSSFSSARNPEHWQEQHDRVVAKLRGFIQPEQVLWDYNLKDTSVAASYARAIAAYRMNKVEESLSQMNALIEREPDNPYFWELKGQILMDFGRIEDSIKAYEKSLSIQSNAPLIRIAYAHSLIESGTTETRLEEAIKQLHRAAQKENRSTRLQRLLATAYGKMGQTSLAQLHLAEEALLRNDIKYAKERAEIALRGLSEGSQGWIRAQDILHFADQKQDKG